jgi:hypothetical protein
LGHVFDPDLDENAAGIAYVLAIAKDTGITIPGLISFIAFNVFAIPCFAATATAKSELPKGKFKGTIASGSARPTSSLRRSTRSGVGGGLALSGLARLH